MTDFKAPQPAPTTGSTRIPIGTLIFHDHGSYRWPECGNEADADPDTEFDVSLSGDTVQLKAPGFGGDPYHNGSIFVKLSHWRRVWGVLAAAQAEHPGLPNVTKTAPKSIYLVIGEDCPPEADFTDCDEVTWCADKIDENSIKYVRADIGVEPELLEIVRITIGNVRSLGPAGALAAVHTPYREWLAQLESVYTKVTGAAA